MLSTDSLLSSTRAELRVREIDFRTDARWQEFVTAHPQGLIYHHPAWLSTLEREYGRKCISLGCEDRDGKLRAILPLAYTKGLPFKVGRHATGRRLSSLPRTPVAGPLALDEEAETEIVRAAVEMAESEPGVLLEIKSQVEGLERTISGLGCVPWRYTYVEELPAAAEGEAWEDFCEGIRLPRNCGPCKGCRRLRFGNAKKQHKVNWAVNKAQKMGLQVRFGESDQDLKMWYDLYLLTMRHNAVPPRSLRFFMDAWSTLGAEGHMQLLLAEQRTSSQNRLVAGSILLMFGQTVSYAFTGCDPADLPLHANDIIQIEAIRHACKSGFRWYDFGEVAEDHESLAQFKGKWGTEPKRLYRYYYPQFATGKEGKSGRLSSLARRAWRALPLKATVTLGDWLYRYM